MIKAVVFDLDGTLLDTLDDLAAALDHALAAFGIRGVSVERVRRYVGNGVPKLIDRALCYAVGGEDGEVFADRALVSACLAVFTEYYDAHNADLTAPYAGVGDMLGAVKAAGLKSAIVTNKYEGAAVMLKNRFFADVDAAVGARAGLRPKPAPDGVYAALAELGIAAADCVYVGDGETDIATARACGMPIVAVSWGFRDRATLEKLRPDVIIDRPSELMGALERLGYRGERA